MALTDLIAAARRTRREQGLRMLLEKGQSFLYLRTLRYLYRIGSVRTCPVCDRASGRFLPSGPGGRIEAVCPHCLAGERHRLLALYLRRELEIVSFSGRLLHTTPHPALERRLRDLDCSYVTMDLRSGDVRADLTRLPFADGAFDGIVCSHVLEHIPDDGRAMAELHRVLADGGWALIVVPKSRDQAETVEVSPDTSPAVRRERFGVADHYREYGRDVTDRLAEAGFSVEIVAYADRLEESAVDCHGLRIHDADPPRIDDIHVCRKE